MYEKMWRPLDVTYASPFPGGPFPGVSRKKGQLAVVCSAAGYCAMQRKQACGRQASHFRVTLALSEVSWPLVSMDAPLQVVVQELGSF